MNTPHGVSNGGSDRSSPAVVGTRNEDATINLSSLVCCVMPDGTLVFQSFESSRTVVNLRRDPYCWVLLSGGRAEQTSIGIDFGSHLIGSGPIEATAPVSRVRTARTTDAIGEFMASPAERVTIRFRPEPC